jgi:hypothetical protein
MTSISNTLHLFNRGRYPFSQSVIFCSMCIISTHKKKKQNTERLLLTVFLFFSLWYMNQIRLIFFYRFLFCMINQALTLSKYFFFYLVKKNKCINDDSECFQVFLKHGKMFEHYCLSDVND